MSADLIPLADAAAALGIEPKRLLGFMARNSVGDPIGGSTPDGIMVYAWSLEPLRMRLRASDDSALTRCWFCGSDPAQGCPRASGECRADEAGAVKLTTDRESASHE